MLFLAEQPDDEGALAALVANHAQLAGSSPVGGGVILSARPHRVCSKIQAIIAVSGRAGMNTSAY